MSRIDTSSTVPVQAYFPRTSNRQAGTAANTTGSQEDSVQLSPAAQWQLAQTGRIALDQQYGVLTSDQAGQLNSQLSTIQSTLTTDLQNDGGTLTADDAQSIRTLQQQLSASIYSDAHNGAAPPSGVKPTVADAREALLAGRVALNEQAGNFTSDQASQFYAQIASIAQQIQTDQSNNSGTLTNSDKQTINQLQNTLRQQIAAA